jgi:hypothetical protein
VPAQKKLSSLSKKPLSIYYSMQKRIFRMKVKCRKLVNLLPYSCCAYQVRALFSEPSVWLIFFSSYTRLAPRKSTPSQIITPLVRGLLTTVEVTAVSVSEGREILRYISLFVYGVMSWAKSVNAGDHDDLSRCRVRSCALFACSVNEYNFTRKYFIPCSI